MKNLNEAFSDEESKEIYNKFQTIIDSRRDYLKAKYDTEGERIAYSTAVNQVKQKAVNKTKKSMDQNQKLKEMIQNALSEKKKKKEPFKDLTGDNKITYADVLKARGVELDEDLDLGHQDNEPHMLKADLYRIGKYAMELYKMVDQFEGEQEVDFPHWWQAKIIEAKNMLVSAKHYLDFETKEPQIDAMVDVASEEGAIGENMIDDISYRNSNNIMRGIYDLAKKSKDVESFKDKWYEIYSRGPQDKDADTDEWLEKTYTRVMSRVTTEEMTPEKSRKKGMPFKNVAEEGALDEMSKKQIKKRGEIFDTLVAKGMPKKKAGPIATSTAMKEAKAKIKEAILAKLKNK